MKNKKIYFIFTFLLSLLSMGLTQKMMENDTFTAIKIGDYIIKNGIDFKEHLNEFNTLNFHNARWLFNVIVSFIHSHFGFTGIYIFTILVVIAIALALFNVLIKKKVNIYISFFLTAITIAMLRAFFVPRAQIFSYLFLILEIFFIERILESNKKLDYLWLFIICVLFANIHTTLWLMSLIVILPYFAEYILSKFKFIKKIDIVYSDPINIKRLILIFITVLITGFITPLGLLPFTYMIKTLLSLKETILIQELGPVKILSDFGAYLISYAIIIFAFIYKKVKIRISDLFMILGLGILAASAIRNVSMFIIITTIIIGKMINSLLSKYSDKEEMIMSKVTQLKYITVIISIITIGASLLTFSINNSFDYVNKMYSPVEISNYILENYDEDIIIFNDFNSGAYLEYRGIKAFIDSRSEIYCKQFNDTEIMKDFSDLVNGLITYNTLFEKYNIKLVIVGNNFVVNTYLNEDNNYKKILEEDNYTLYEKIQ